LIDACPAEKLKHFKIDISLNNNFTDELLMTINTRVIEMKDLKKLFLGLSYSNFRISIYNEFFKILSKLNRLEEFKLIADHTDINDESICLMNESLS